MCSTVALTFAGAVYSGIMHCTGDVCLLTVHGPWRVATTYSSCMYVGLWMLPGSVWSTSSSKQLFLGTKTLTHGSMSLSRLSWWVCVSCIYFFDYCKIHLTLSISNGFCVQWSVTLTAPIYSVCMPFMHNICCLPLCSLCMYLVKIPQPMCALWRVSMLLLLSCFALCPK